MDIQMTKEDALARVNMMDKDKRNQQAIVDLMTGKGKIKRTVHQIPGGIHLVDQIDQENLPAAVYTWVRRVRDFERFELSFIGDYDIYEDLADHGIKPKKQKVQDFGWKPGMIFFWRKKGVKELANLISGVLADHENIVSLIVEKEGIFIITDLNKQQPFGPEHTDFNPVLIIHQS